MNNKTFQSEVPKIPQEIIESGNSESHEVTRTGGLLSDLKQLALIVSFTVASAIGLANANAQEENPTNTGNQVDVPTECDYTSGDTTTDTLIAKYTRAIMVAKNQCPNVDSNHLAELKKALLDLNADISSTHPSCTVSDLVDDGTIETVEELCAKKTSRTPKLQATASGMKGSDTIDSADISNISIEELDSHIARINQDTEEALQAILELSEETQLKMFGLLARANLDYQRLTLASDDGKKAVQALETLPGATEKAGQLALNKLNPIINSMRQYLEPTMARMGFIHLPEEFHPKKAEQNKVDAMQKNLDDAKSRGDNNAIDVAQKNLDDAKWDLELEKLKEIWVGGNTEKIKDFIKKVEALAKEETDKWRQLKANLFLQVAKNVLDPIKSNIVRPSLATYAVNAAYNLLRGGEAAKRLIEAEAIRKERARVEAMTPTPAPTQPSLGFLQADRLGDFINAYILKDQPNKNPKLSATNPNLPIVNLSVEGTYNEATIESNKPNCPDTLLQREATAGAISAEWQFSFLNDKIKLYVGPTASFGSQNTFLTNSKTGEMITPSGLFGTLGATGGAGFKIIDGVIAGVKGGGAWEWTPESAKGWQGGVGPFIKIGIFKGSAEAVWKSSHSKGLNNKEGGYNTTNKDEPGIKFTIGIDG